MSTMVVVIIELLISLPIEKAVMNVIFRTMMMSSMTGWSHTVDRSENICGNVPDRICYLWGGSVSRIS